MKNNTHSFWKKFRLHNHHHLIILITILFLAGFLRIAHLDKIPTGISNDELGFIINSKAVFLTGQNIAGNWSPFSLTTITGEFPQAEIPYLLMSPFIGMLPLSLLLSKLPYAVVSVLMVALLFFITKKLVGKNEAIVVSLAAALNPWSIFFGRTAYEAPLAIFFYLAGLCILLYAKKRRILLAFIPLFLGFYSYMGAKLILLPFIFIVSTFCYIVINRKKYLRYYLILNVLCIVLLAFFIISSKYQATGERMAELSSPFNPVIASVVNNERRLSIHTPLTEIISNKPVVWLKEMATKYLKVFSTELLFTNGEARSTFSLWYHGYFYYTDFVFIIVGLCVLYKRKRSAWWLIIGLVIIAPIPTVLSNVESGFAALRSALLFPILIILIGVGVWYAASSLKSNKYKSALAILIVGIYTLQFLNFINIYLFRNPIYNSESYSLSSRIISKYISLAANRGQSVYVIVKDPKNEFQHFLFDTNSYNQESAMRIREGFILNKFEHNNIRFIKCEENILIPRKTSVAIISDPNLTCDGMKHLYIKKNLTIARLEDGGAIFNIYNDIICRKYQLKNYPHNFNLSDFAVERLTEKIFCEKFIIDQPK